MQIKEVIKERKAMYGNNFPAIAKSWGMDGESEAVAQMFALMKQTRIEAILYKLKEDMPDNRLIDSLEDSFLDYQAYMWIADNYDEYCRM